MIRYHYENYSDIPANVVSYICNVAGVKKVTDLSLSEIKIFLNNMEEYYQENNQSLTDFVN